MNTKKDVNFDLKQLRSFLEIIQEKSFTRASRKLKIGQATISHHIQHLEELLGVSLFERNSKNVSITPEGAVAQEFAENLLKDFEMLQQRLNGEIFGGTLHIAASTIPAAYLLPGIIADIKSPDLLFTITASDSREAIELVKEGKADMGIVGRRVQHPSLAYSHIYSDEIVLASPPDAPDRISRDELLDLPIISREKGSGTRNATEGFLASLEILPSELKVVYECTSNDGVKESVIKGIGYAFISRLAIKRELDLGLLKTVSLKGLPVKRDFYMVRLKSKKNIALIKRFQEKLETKNF